MATFEERLALYRQQQEEEEEAKEGEPPAIEEVGHE